MNLIKIDYKALFFSIIGALILLGFAFYNGYPIVYSDTSTYIDSGFSLQPPADRPITYGIFIRIMSLNGTSLWSVVFFQSLIISFLILLTIKDFTQFKKPNVYFLFVVAFLSTLTVIPFISGQIITDIFLAIGILCILHLTLNTKLKKFNSILLFIIFFIANAMHMSHLMIHFLLLICILSIKRIFLKDTVTLKFINIWVLFVLTFLGIFLMGSSLAKSKHVFFMGRMAENGILKEFLNDNCESNRYKLCECIDSIPTNTTDFLWDKNSPLNTKYDKWGDTQAEFGEIIRLTIFKPKYLAHHIFEAIKNTFKQLLVFNAGDGTGSFVEETLLYERIQKYFKFESIEYSISKQNRGLLTSENLKSVNARYCLVIIFCVLIILLVSCSTKLKNQIKGNKAFFIYMLLIAIFINSLINASLVLVTDRFGAKLIWLVPFILLLVVSEIDFMIRQNLDFQKNHELGS